MKTSNNLNSLQSLLRRVSMKGGRNLGFLGTDSPCIVVTVSYMDS